MIGGGISWSLDETRAVAHGAAGRSLTGAPLSGTVRRRDIHQGGGRMSVPVSGRRPPARRRARKDGELSALADSVRAYLQQIGKIGLLTAEQEVQLAQRIEAGLYAAERLRRANATEQLSRQLRRDLWWIVRDGKRAKNHLLEANLRLVVSLAKRHTGRGIAFLDLVQEGNVGLIRAVEKFDYTQGYKFSTYATWWIRRRSLARWPIRSASSTSR